MIAHRTMRAPVRHADKDGPMPSHKLQVLYTMISRSTRSFIVQATLEDPDLTIRDPVCDTRDFDITRLYLECVSPMSIK